MLGLQMHDEDQCACGFPWWMGHNPSTVGSYRRDYGHCLICEKLEEDRTGDGVQPGDRVFVENELFKAAARRFRKQAKRRG